jgi:geranylgeranyl diphosphate synthase, type II
MNFDHYLKQQIAHVDAALDRWIPAETVAPATIHRAMRYSIFAGGKRIRPVLCLAAAEAISNRVADAADAACSLELIHTYSLIHDDLPALDNDDLRRGRPTNHVVFGEAMAILAGDSLLTLAFQVLSHLPQTNAETRLRLVQELSVACGTVDALIGGQVEDLEGEGKPHDAALLERIHRGKTGALLRCSVRLGAILAGADQTQLNAITAYGEHIGLAFQIVDDLLDIEQSSEQLGKTAGKDQEQGKMTFPAVYGLETSRTMAADHLAAAHHALSIFGERGQHLHHLAALIVERKT